MCSSNSEMSWVKKVELLFSSVIFGLFNNISTILNAKVLLETGYSVAGGLTIFFLLFPGIVTSVGFLVLHWAGHRKIGRIPPISVLVYFISLLLFYPVVPIILCLYTLITGKNEQEAALSKLFEGFLDDGPQFVLRLVVVVLFGIGIGHEKHDVIFIMSMITSFGALVYFGLRFNERTTHGIVKWLVAFPMFAASVASRGFTLAVFLKETLDNKSEWIGGLLVLIVYIASNVVIFKLLGQDWVRSLVFGLSSSLIPAGYNNDLYYYQCPHQPLVERSNYSISPENNRDSEEANTEETAHNKMRSGLFLIMHTVINTIFLSSCAVYISLTRDLSMEANDALIFPQVLAVIPGCFFTLARSVLLLDDEKPAVCHDKVWKGTKIVLATIFALIAYGSLIPALFWSLIWKVASVAIDQFES